MLRFGLQLPSFTFADVTDGGLFDRVVETALAAESSGFDSFWVMDHLHQIPTVGPEDEPMLEGYTALAGVAARTRTINLGTLVSAVTYRNPALLAKIVTTLDVVSGGRALLGIGAAWNVDEATRYGYEWPSDRERLDRLEDALRICRAMFRNPSATVEGRVHSIREAVNVPRPIRPGGPPILIGGGGERRTLRLVAQYADACNLFGDVDMIRHKLDILDQHCADVGRDPSEITRTRLGSLIIAPTKAEAEARLEAWESRPAQANARWRPTVLAGDPDTVGDGVQAFFDAGLGGLIFNMPAAKPEDVALAGRTLTERFGRVS